MRRALILLFLIGACGGPARSGMAPLVDPSLELLVTPSPDHAPFVRAIDAATASVDMAMFHLTDREVVDALSRAAQRGVAVRVILDAGNLKDKKGAAVRAALERGGVRVMASSAGFSITHEKMMVIDRKRAFITAINLTTPVAVTRDFGIVTSAAGVVDEIERVFEADLANAASGGADTPALREPALVWSPVSARPKLVGLIDSAVRTLDVTVENLGDPEIERALAAAAARKLAVRLIVPACDKNPDPHHNFPPAKHLAAAGIAVRMMGAPESADQPYMHSKMILADGASAYVGSVNFSVNSTTKARELGVIFANADAIAKISAAFAQDWERATAIPEPPPGCDAAGEPRAPTR